MEAKDFIEQFHGLPGTLLKERKKALQLLLNKFRNLENNDEVLKEINANLIPRTFLEETYKLEFLVYFKRVSELFEVLKTANDAVANRIIQQKWLILGIMKDRSPKKFVEDLFPQLSLIIRLKILKQILKLFKDEAFINCLFDELNKMYGSRYALVLISGCSVTKIKHFLSERRLKMSLAQLKLFHDKDKSLIRFYYEEYHKRGGNLNDLRPFSQYLSKKDPNLFVELVTKYKLKTNTNLGRKATKYFVQQNREALTEDPDIYLDLGILKKSTLVRQLQGDSTKFLKVTFPNNWRDINNSWQVFDLLRFYPKKRRYETFSKVFKEVYHKDLLSAKDIFTEELLQVIPSYEEREKWVKLFDNKLSFVPYKRSTVAIPELKEQLLRADSINFRKELLEYIVISCGINEDYEALLDILKLVCKRFRNAEDGTMFSTLAIIETKTDLTKLSSEHWKLIYEIILLQDVKNATLNSDIIFECCKFLHSSGESFEKLIPILLKCPVFLSSFKFVDENFRDQNFQKLFLQNVLKYYVFLDEKYKATYKAVHIVIAIKEWNKKHRNDLILVSQVEAIIKGIQDEVKQRWVCGDGFEMKALTYLVCFESDSDNFESIYFENINVLADYSMTKWFLKYKPEVFRKHVEKIKDCFIGKGRILTRFLRKLEHLNLVNDVEEFCIKKLKEPEQDDRDQFAQILSSIMPTEKYIHLINSYIPKGDKLEISNVSDEEKTLLQIEMSLAKTVRFSKCHRKSFPIILNYCQGDCLQPALHSLYSCFSNIPEDELKPYLSLLLSKPVSLKKHSIFLAALMFPVEVRDEIREKIMNDETNISVKKHLFTSSYKYFLGNPLEHLWSFFLIYMESLTAHDKETLDLIVQIHEIPGSFTGRFAEAVWRILEKIEQNGDISMNEYYNKFFSNIEDYDIKLLPVSFCSRIIETKMFDEEHKRNTNCTKFAVQFMMFSGETRQAVRSVMKILQDYKTKYWEGEKMIKAKFEVYQFCQEIFDIAMNEEQLRLKFSQEFPSILAEEWKKLFKPEEIVEENLMLDFIILKYGNDKSLEFLSRKVGELFELARAEYGELILLLFRDFLEYSLCKLLGDKKFKSKLMEFLRYFIGQGPISQTRYLLIINLLPERFGDETFKKNYDFVVQRICDIKDPIISVSLGRRHKTC